MMNQTIQDVRMSGIQVQVLNQLNIASIASTMQSSLSMVLLELATNIIKHARQSHRKIRLYSGRQTLNC